MAKKKRILFRKWLNKSGYHSTGLVFIDVDDLNNLYPYVSLTIGDCSRQISLEFNPEMTNLRKLEASMANSRYKLAVLREGLDKIEEALDYMEVNGPILIKERDKRRKEAKKKKKKSKK